MKKRYIILTILFIIVSVFTINYISVNADSGWDTSYDSSSWDSGSSWDSSDWGSSDWGSSSYDYNYGGSHSHRNSSEDSIAGIIVFIIIFIIILISIASKNANTYSTPSVPLGKDYYDPDSSTENVIERIKDCMPDFDETSFLNSTYQTFLDVQNAWMNIDYDKLRTLLTDELYNTYYSQLKVLQVKKQKNIMDGFHLNNHRLASFNTSNNQYTIKTYLNVAFYDYVVDKDEQVLRGNKYRKVVMTYELTFVRTKSEKSNTCPNCHAPLPKGASNKCEYCGSIITSGNYNWVLSKKQVINQNWER